MRFILALLAALALLNPLATATSALADNENPGDLQTPDDTLATLAVATAVLVEATYIAVAGSQYEEQQSQTGYSEGSSVGDGSNDQYTP